MWNVFNLVFGRVGVVDNFSEVTINHNFYEVDTLSFSIPYDEDTYNLLKLGFILHKRGTDKGFIIHTLEIRESENLIWGYAYGLEALLNDRVVIFPRYFNTNAETIMHTLVNENMISASATYRNFPNLTKETNLSRGTVSEENYWGQTLYSIFIELGRRNGMGFKIHFNPYDQQYIFKSKFGTDRTILQDTNKIVRWVSEWNDTFDEALLSSKKDYKTNMYIASGDDVPIQLLVGDTFSVKSGFSRKESFIQSSDITKTLQDESGTTLTVAQVEALLRSKAKMELNQLKKIEDYTFTLSEGIDEVYGIDYVEGDYVSVAHEGYDIVKHQQIITVEERILGNTSQFNIKFDE